MSDTIWSSEAIHASDAVCIDVRVNKTIVLGVLIGKGEVAIDCHLPSPETRSLAAALNRAADEHDRAGGAQ